MFWCCFENMTALFALTLIKMCHPSVTLIERVKAAVGRNLDQKTLKLKIDNPPTSLPSLI